MQVQVVDNNVEKAIKALKRKLTKEGVFRQLKENAGTRSLPTPVAANSGRRAAVCAASWPGRGPAPGANPATGQPAQMPATTNRG